MPDWPRPPDVVFDHAAAQAAIDEIDRTLSMTGTVVAALDLHVPPADDNWSGRLHARFVADERRWRDEIVRAAAALRSLADVAAGAVTDAHAAAAEVERLQHLWDTEATVERAALLADAGGS